MCHCKKIFAVITYQHKQDLLKQQQSHTEQENCMHSEEMEMSKNVSRYTTAIPLCDTGCNFLGV